MKMIKADNLAHNFGYIWLYRRKWDQQRQSRRSYGPSPSVSAEFDGPSHTAGSLTQCCIQLKTGAHHCVFNGIDLGRLCDMDEKICDDIELTPSCNLLTLSKPRYNGPG